MRKRAQQKSKPVIEEPKHIAQQIRPKFEYKPPIAKKNWWIAISLIGIFLLVLFLNTYWNLTSEVSINPESTDISKFYLSGPDPYYNMRLVEGTFETGRYPYYSVNDPLLNYPVTAGGGRAPLFNMVALGFSRLLSPFMNDIDAIGYSMQFIPALFGALLIFPVYFIGKELFNKKAGLIAALFIAIIPIHLGSGHGSAYALFDHDSFNLLLFFLAFLFLIKSIKEKDSTKSILYAILAGVPLAALSMTWVEAQFLYTVIAIYTIVQMLIDMFTNKIELKVFRTTSIVLFSGYLISLPILLGSKAGFRIDTPLFLCIVITAFGFVYYIFGRKKIPWTITFPIIFSIAGVGLIFLYFIEDIVASFPILSPVQSLSNVLFGSGIYGTKVSMTIAEANTYQISHTVMSFGPAIYWLGWAGFVYLMYRYYKNKNRRDYLFIIMLFIINIWLAGTAGRFLNDMVPLIAILGGWIVWIFIEWIDYKQMLRNIRSAGGGFHGIRRGIKFLHIFGILFVAFLVILPNAFTAFDAAVPNAFTKNRTSILKIDMFGEDHRGAFGLGVGKERYWADAFGWLNDQDLDIEDPTKRPAFISWWDYGFYEVALGGHPTVADNFQDGIPPAANFHTSTSEEEAVIVLIVRILEGSKRDNKGKLPDEVVEILEKYIGEENSVKIIQWFDKPTSSPSYGEPIGAEYDENTSKDYTVGQQYERNAVYHDVVELLTDETTGISDEKITWLYHDIQEATGYSIRYYGVEGYDRQIFNIFGFLSDKSLLLVNGIADDFIELLYEGYEVDPQTGEKIPGTEFAKPAKEIIDMEPEKRRYTVVTGTQQKYKDLYFDTMFYRTYIGPPKGDPGSYSELDWQIPCYDMRHFYAEYISDLNKFPYYNTGKGAVVMAKYYEGAIINGTVIYEGAPIEAQVVVQKNLTYTDVEGATLAIDHDKFDIDPNQENATGEFSVIAGAGNLTLQIRRYPELGQNAFIFKNIVFDSNIDPELFPISEEDAMRKYGSDYERYLNITIDPANIDGYVFNDKDDDGSYNASIDEPLTDIAVLLSEITDPMGEEVPQAVDIAEVDENGYYNITNFIPGFYRVSAATDDGLIIHLKDFVSLYSGNNSYDIPKPKDAKIEGIVYEDENQNDEFDSGDKLMSNVDVKLVFNEKEIDSDKTDEDGKYSFDLLIPGRFIGDDRDLNTYNITVTSLPEYYTEVTVSPEENETTFLNISIELAPVTVSGFTKFSGVAVSNVSIYFEVDESVEKNTAIEDFITSIDDGSYVIDLKPGNYNITIEKYEDETLIYTFEGKLELIAGEGTKSFDISLDKQSATIEGPTIYEGTRIPNIAIGFDPSEPIENNTAVSATTISDENGYYSIELTPGSYDVLAISKSFTENGKNYSYEFSGTLNISTQEAKEGKIYTIKLLKIESD